MKVYEVFKNGKIETITAQSFLNIKAIALRVYFNNELQWQSPDYDKYVSINRNSKLKSLGI